MWLNDQLLNYYCPEINQNVPNELPTLSLYIYSLCFHIYTNMHILNYLKYVTMLILIMRTQL